MQNALRKLAFYANEVPLPRASADPARAILLTGSPRSGTTWLGQVLAASADYCLVNEVLDPRMPQTRRSGFGWRDYLDPAAEWPAGRAALQRYVRGRGVSLKLVRRNRGKALSCRGLVLKEIRANRLLPWIAGQFPDLRLAYVLRHPCAVISSQLVHPRIGRRRADELSEDDQRYLDLRLPHLLPWAASLRTPEELRTLTWALDQHAPLSSPLRAAWLQVSYEQLILREQAAFRELFEALRLPSSPEREGRIRRSSWQAQTYSADHSRASPEDRLGLWRGRLDAGRVRRILDVVRTCGIRGFGEDPVPDFDAIGVAP
ncbi:MAG: sulfotransferase [Gemmatimonadota bacterium]